VPLPRRKRQSDAVKVTSPAVSAVQVTLTVKVTSPTASVVQVPLDEVRRLAPTDRAKRLLLRTRSGRGNYTYMRGVDYSFVAAMIIPITTNRTISP